MNTLFQFIIVLLASLAPPLTGPATLGDAQESLAPPGFAAVDRFEGDAYQACLVLSKEHVPQKWRNPVYSYCEHRTFHSSRGNKIVSRIDGTKIHDRDRYVAWKFYARYFQSGRIDPLACEYHVIDRDLKHPREERQLAQRWPYKNGCVPDENGDRTCSRAHPGKLREEIRSKWLKHPYDMERFGTRGDHDHNLGHALKYLPGCYPPEALDRTDVSVMVTINKAMAICEEHGCRTKADIKEHW